MPDEAARYTDAVSVATYYRRALEDIVAGQPSGPARELAEEILRRVQIRPPGP
jgi:hypothetical protein